MDTHVLCIDDDPRFLLALKASLKKHYKVSTALDFKTGQAILKTKTVDVVFLDINLGDEDGIDSLKMIKAFDANVDVIILSGYKDPKLIVVAMKEGASDYLCKPCPSEELIAVIEKNRRNKDVKERYDALMENLNEQQSQFCFVGKSRAFQDVLASANKLKGYDASVLIEGESGTGKELLARYVHRLENNPKRPFIVVNCAAIPENLIESELFGHEAGAFTGASKRKIGKFELASGGDIFLDEINSLKLELQSKLLRVLQEKEFYRVGGTQPIKVDVRVISASNTDLQYEVSCANFRQDLLYRLRVISLKMPTLKDRKIDIPDLIECFLKKFSRAGQQKSIDPELMTKLEAYEWPGNVRELENLMQSLVILSRENEITLNDLPSWMSSTHFQVNGFENLSMLPTIKTDGINESLKGFLNKIERQYIQHKIKELDGNVTKAAEMLKISRSKLYYTLKGEELH